MVADVGDVVGEAGNFYSLDNINACVLEKIRKKEEGKKIRDSGEVAGNVMNVEALEKMLAAGTDNAMLRFTLGKAYFDSQDYDKAVEHLRVAVIHDPQYSAALKWLGRALSESGERNEAMQVFREGIAIAAEKGDKQAEKEMQVFLRRLEKN